MKIVNLPFQFHSVAVIFPIAVLNVIFTIQRFLVEDGHLLSVFLVVSLHTVIITVSSPLFIVTIITSPASLMRTSLHIVKQLWLTL